jgi:hypothetical protein
VVHCDDACNDQQPYSSMLVYTDYLTFGVCILWHDPLLQIVVNAKDGTCSADVMGTRWYL